jgi:hypothetical protein
VTATTPFSQAVEAIVTGDESGLRALLHAHAGLVHERAPFAHRATLLHYVAANGVEVQRSPKNAPAIARVSFGSGRGGRRRWRAFTVLPTRHCA